MSSEGVEVRLVIPGSQASPSPAPSSSPSPSASPTAPAPDPAVPGLGVPSTPDSATPHLPRTGVEVLALLLIAVVLLVLGVLLVRAGRSRRALST